MRKSTIGLALGGAALLTVPALAAPDWSYETTTGPDNWGDLNPAYELCKNGMMQSPIDLAETNARGEVVMLTDYKPGALNILNTGYTVQANFEEGSTLTSGTMQFNLIQVHFHTPSEEALNGVQYPMVGHFVHADDDGNLAVLGVFYKEGTANAELEKIVKAAPTGEAAPRNVSGTAIDPNGMLPDDLSVYRFQGSLTTPPCSEGVNWHVAKVPVSASAEQIAAMEGIMGNNARPLQPVNGRLILAPN